MADFYKNIDKLGCRNTTSGMPAKGIQYSVVEDLQDEPVDVSFFKKHARIDYNTDDNLIKKYLKAARQQLEQWSQLSFGVKTINLKALQIPDNYRLMFGRVDEVITSGFDNFGDILEQGGEKVDIKFTTKYWIDETIKIAICRYAAGLYIYRENVNTELKGKDYIDEAKAMLAPYMNVTIL